MGVLEKWFEKNRRAFPWREEITPYRVWISEVMLQQTRASVVIPYFLRWMELFPNVKALYNASLTDVIKAWEGLGYYSRARNIHKAARQIVEEFHGEIPDTKEELSSIVGFGPYTVGAVLSFAFHQKATAVDGNVLRVISRLFCIEEEVSKGSVRRKIEEKTLSLLNNQTPWVTMEALIELGATVCSPKPCCDMCPLQMACEALRLGKEKNLPLKRAREPTISLFRAVFVFFFEGKVWASKQMPGEVMADLYEFPYVELPEAPSLSEIKRLVPLEASFLAHLPPFSHTFTRYKCHLFPVLLSGKGVLGLGEWISLDQMLSLPFSSGHRKIAIEIEKILMHR